MRVLALIVKAMMIVIIVLAVVSYISYLRTGRFWVPNISMQSIKYSLPFINRSTPSMQTLGSPKDTIYKWREQGKWVYGQNPPDGVEAQLLSEKEN